MLDGCLLWTLGSELTSLQDLRIGLVTSSSSPWPSCSSAHNRSCVDPGTSRFETHLKNSYFTSESCCYIVLSFVHSLIVVCFRCFTGPTCSTSSSGSSSYSTEESSGISSSFRVVSSSSSTSTSSNPSSKPCTVACLWRKSTCCPQKWAY